MELMDKKTIRLGAGEGKALWVLGDLVKYKVAANQTGGAYSLFEVEVRPRGGPPPHVQHHEDECLYVLGGDFEFAADGETARAGEGCLIYIPKGALHTYKNVGSAPGRLLAVQTPGGIHERFFEEIGGEADIGKIIAAAARHGIEVPPQKI